jgi:hypothetical protein
MPQPISIDRNFPGGNIIVDSIEAPGDVAQPVVARVRQDRANTEGWWFYWHLRIRNAGGRTVRFVFTDGNVFTGLGPCYTLDGATWNWLGRQSVQVSRQGDVEHAEFTFTFPPDCHEARFALAHPYASPELEAFLASHPEIERSTLTQSEAGREVPLLRLRSRTGQRIIALQARSHACEATANYAIEGFIEYWLNDPAMRESIDLLVAPFVDYDGVEAGDQGKNRIPHDHNRDWVNSGARYRAIRALQDLYLQNSTRLAMFLDLHCPWIRIGRNEATFAVLREPPADRAQREFGRVLNAVQTGPIHYDPSDNIDWGVEWNTAPTATAATSTGWFARRLPRCPALSWEIPYALAHGREMTTNGARLLGRDLARAAGKFLSL